MHFHSRKCIWKCSLENGILPWPQCVKNSHVTRFYKINHNSNWAELDMITKPHSTTHPSIHIHFIHMRNIMATNYYMYSSFQYPKYPGEIISSLPYNYAMFTFKHVIVSYREQAVPINGDKIALLWSPTPRYILPSLIQYAPLFIGCPRL